MDDVPVPAYSELLWPTVLAVRGLGGSGSIDEIVEAVIEEQGFSDAQQRVLHGDGPTTEIEYRLAWARSYLKFMGLLINSRRGVWSLTEEGRAVSEEAIGPLHAQTVARLRQEQRARRRAGGSDGALQVGRDRESITADETLALEEEPDWQDALLDILRSLPADAFERLSQRLLREAGFISTTVTGRSGDGGIDGLGIYRMSLVSFPVFFQCKRYKDSVGPDAVRDFRGAMEGRGDKGLLITTGTFTAAAKAEATRDGARPIDLIDGRRLCDLLKQHDLGVTVQTRVVEDIKIDKEFFADL